MYGLFTRFEAVATKLAAAQIVILTEYCVGMSATVKLSAASLFKIEIVLNWAKRSAMPAITEFAATPFRVLGELNSFSIKEGVMFSAIFYFHSKEA
jgi:hypothetical protein